MRNNLLYDRPAMPRRDRETDQIVHDHGTTKVEELRDTYGGPDPHKDPHWWADTSNFDGDLADLF